MAALPHDINPVCGGVRHASLLPIYSHGTAHAARSFAEKSSSDTVDKIMLSYRVLRGFYRKVGGFYPPLCPFCRRKTVDKLGNNFVLESSPGVE